MRYQQLMGSWETPRNSGKLEGIQVIKNETSVIHIAAGDTIQLKSGVRGRVKRWYIHRNDALMLPNERVAEVALSNGGSAEFSERYMRGVTKLEP